MLDFTEWKLRKISRRLNHFELQEPEGEEFELTEESLQEQLLTHESKDLFLDFYTRKGIENALIEYGIWERLIKKGFSPNLSIKHIDSRVNLLRITDGLEGPILMEVQARLSVIRPLESYGSLNPKDLIDLLGIEWLMMQNPQKKFCENRWCLPGQDFPGLGMGHEISILLRIMAERLKTEGLLGFPQYYHNGVFYNTRFNFFVPKFEGEILALERDLQKLDLAVASWAIKEGLISYKKTGEIYHWKTQEMIWPISQRLQYYFSDKEYQKQKQHAFKTTHFEYDPKKVAELANRVKEKQGKTEG